MKEKLMERRLERLRLFVETGAPAELAERERALLDAGDRGAGDGGMPVGWIVFIAIAAAVLLVLLGSGLAASMLSSNISQIEEREERARRLADNEEGRHDVGEDSDAAAGAQSEWADLAG